MFFIYILTVYNCFVICFIHVTEKNGIWGLEHQRTQIWHFSKQKTGDFRLHSIVKIWKNIDHAVLGSITFLNSFLITFLSGHGVCSALTQHDSVLNPACIYKHWKLRIYLKFCGKVLTPNIILSMFNKHCQGQKADTYYIINENVGRSKCFLFFWKISHFQEVKFFWKICLTLGQHKYCSLSLCHWAHILGCLS